MDTEIPHPKKKIKLIWKIVIAVIIFLILAFGAVFTIGYYYYGKLIKTSITEFVKTKSKGIYTADIGYLYINILSGNLTIKDLSLIPDTVEYRKREVKDTLPPMLFQLKVKNFRIKNFLIMDAIRHHKIDINGIHIENPEITILRMQQRTPQSSADKKSDKIMAIPLPKGLTSISIKEILFLKGKFDFIDFSGDSVIRKSIPSCSVTIKNILVDSAHQGKKRLFNADDISIVLNGLTILTKNKLNLISLGEIGLSTSKNSVYVKDFHLIPQYDRRDYMKKFGWQTDRLDILVPMLTLNHLDLRQLIFEGKFLAGSLEVNGLVVDDYRDKRIPRKPGFQPPMPQDGLRKLKAYLKIDTVILRDGKATYSEQTGEEPGSIFFDKMNATLTGLTNDSALLQAGLVSVLKGTAYLMGKGKMNVELKFRFGDKHNGFSFSGYVGPMDLREVNPMLTKLLPAEIISGNITQISIPLVVANDDVAKGHMAFCYTGLKLKLNNKEETTWGSIKTGVIGWVANDFVVSNDNPAKSGKTKSGIIHFNRDKEKGIINFIWKSVLSGLKSQMGFNSKEQKEMKKAAKKKAKAAK